MAPKQQKELAASRAERLAGLIRLDAPDCLIQDGSHLLWEALTTAYGADVFERGERRWEEIHQSLRDEDAGGARF